MTKEWLTTLKETYYAMAFLIPYTIEVRNSIMEACILVQIIGKVTM